MPLDWTPGFHSANAEPGLDDVYLFHLKLANVERRASVAEGSSEHDYFSATVIEMRDLKETLSGYPCSTDGWQNTLILIFQDIS